MERELHGREGPNLRCGGRASAFVCSCTATNDAGEGVKELRQITDGVRRSWALVVVVFMLAVTPLGALAVVRAGAQTDTAQGSPISSGPTIGPIG